jgi:hypothetical protein
MVVRLEDLLLCCVGAADCSTLSTLKRLALIGSRGRIRASARKTSCTTLRHNARSLSWRFDRRRNGPRCRIARAGRIGCSSEARASAADPRAGIGLPGTGFLRDRLAGVPRGGMPARLPLHPGEREQGSLITQACSRRRSIMPRRITARRSSR